MSDQKLAFGIHIALSHLPMGEERRFIKGIENRCQKYRALLKYGLNKLEEDEEIKRASLKPYKNLYYSPKSYYLFGSFDVAFITLFDSYKFTQRVFEPKFGKDKPKSGNNEFEWAECDEVQPEDIDAAKTAPVSYQILSGAVLSSEAEVRKFFEIPEDEERDIENHKIEDNADVANPASQPRQVEKPEFIQIVSLKISNFLIIGNGSDILDPTLKEIERILLDQKYLLVESHNWAEIILLLKVADATDLMSSLLSILDLKIGSLVKEVAQKIHKQSALAGISSIDDLPIFSESHSYLGVDFYRFLESNHQDLENVELDTVTEWEILPGHFLMFKERFQSVLEFDDINQPILAKHGKTDFVIAEKNASKLSSNRLIAEILEAHGSGTVKKVKTIPLFKNPIGTEKPAAKNATITDAYEAQKSVMQKHFEDKRQNMTDRLCELKVPRDLRKKIQKIIHNYNIGITDPILFIYFLDVKNLLDLMEREIEKFARDEVGSLLGKHSGEKRVQHEVFMVKKVGTLLEKYAGVFEEAIEDRLLNNYNYEDINEFSLHVNASNASLVSSLDSLIKFLDRNLRHWDGGDLVTCVGECETKSNYLSINYNIHHITSPPLIFATLMKEIFNLDNPKTAKAMPLDPVANREDLISEEALTIGRANFYGRIDEVLQEEKYQGYAVLMAGFDKYYFEIDLKKFSLTFFGNYKLFAFWHWAYAFQNPDVYTTIGSYEEQSFLRELLRLLLVWKVMSLEEEVAFEVPVCPLPELRVYWDRHFIKLKDLVERIVAGGRGGPACEFAHLLKGTVADKFAKLFSDKPQARKYFETVSEEIIDLADKSPLILYQNDVRNRKTPSSPEGELILQFCSLSYYNLNFIYKCFDRKPSLLRRSYKDGRIVYDFLASPKKWYLDPMGGFFINDHASRIEYLHLSNETIRQIRDLGMKAKALLYFPKPNSATI